MENQNFQPIFDYIDEKFTNLETGLLSDMATKADIERVINTIDALAKMTKDNDDRLTIVENKSERIEHWVMKAAEKTEIPYKS